MFRSAYNSSYFKIASNIFIRLNLEGSIMLVDVQFENQIHKIEVDPSDSVFELMEKIETYTSVQPNEQTLTCNGNKLDKGDCALLYYNIFHGSVVTLTSNMPDSAIAEALVESSSSSGSPSMPVDSVPRTMDAHEEAAETKPPAKMELVLSKKVFCYLSPDEQAAAVALFSLQGPPTADQWNLILKIRGLETLVNAGNGLPYADCQVVSCLEAEKLNTAPKSKPLSKTRISQIQSELDSGVTRSGVELTAEKKSKMQSQIDQYKKSLAQKKDIDAVTTTVNARADTIDNAIHDFKTYIMNELPEKMREVAEQATANVLAGRVQLDDMTNEEAVGVQRATVRHIHTDINRRQAIIDTEKITEKLALMDPDKAEGYKQRLAAVIEKKIALAEKRLAEREQKERDSQALKASKAQAKAKAQTYKCCTCGTCFSTTSALAEHQDLAVCVSQLKEGNADKDGEANHESHVSESSGSNANAKVKSKAKAKAKAHVVAADVESHVCKVCQKSCKSKRGLMQHSKHCAPDVD